MAKAYRKATTRKPENPHRNAGNVSKYKRALPKINNNAIAGII